MLAGGVQQDVDARQVGGGRAVPMAWPKPSLQARSMSSAVATPDSYSFAGLDDEGGDETGRHEPGDVAVDDDAGLAGGLGELPRGGERFVTGLVAAAPARTAASWGPARRSRPTTRSGRSVTAAILVIGIAEVLDGEDRPRPSTSLSRVRKISCLTSSFSKTASTTTSASAAASRSVVAVMRPRAASASSAVQLPVGDELVVRGPDAVGAAPQRLVGDVPRDDVRARLSGDLGDAGPRETGSDDGVLPRCHGAAHSPAYALILALCRAGRTLPGVYRLVCRTG
ncbi:hypothetical protein STENM223S_06721 [Streptomyces tendae]